MRKYSLILILGFGIALVTGAVQLFGISSGAPAAGVNLLQLLPGESRHWPHDRAWAWSFPLPKNMSEGTVVGIEVREKSKTIEKNTPSMIVSSIALPRGKADRTFGTSWLGDESATNRASGRVAVTLLDLKEIGVQSDKPGKTLRIMATLSIGGGSVGMPAESIYLEGDSFAGWSPNQDAQWSGDELLVLHFAVVSEGRQDDYDVVLVKKHL